MLGFGRPLLKALRPRVFYVADPSWSVECADAPDYDLDYLAFCHAIDAPDLAPDEDDLLGFAYAEPVDFSRDTVSKYPAGNSRADATKGLSGQELGPEWPVQGSDAATYIVVADPRNAALETLAPPVMEPLAAPPKRKGKSKRGRPCKRGRPKGPSIDKRRRTVSGPLKLPQRYDLVDAMDFGEWIGRRPNTTVNLHPKLLDTYPAGDLRDWFVHGPWRDLSEEMRRRQRRARDPLPWWQAVAVAENYVGHRRQHWHVIMWTPDDATRDAIEAMLDRRYPGDGAIDVGTLRETDDDDDDRDGFRYRLKQSCPSTDGPPRPGRRASERVSRFDKAPVAPVMGQRYSMSRSLALPERIATGWQAERDAERQAKRDHWRSKRREDEDAGRVMPVMTGRGFGASIAWAPSSIPIAAAPA